MINLYLRRVLPLFAMFVLLFGCSNSNRITKDSSNLWLNYDTVKAQKFDTGKMWTFEDAPLDYFEITYGFRPTEEWLEEVRLSTLKFASWCTSSFVSEDGLIMTNHHCIDFVSESIQQEGEDLKHNGFYAATLQDERQVPNVFVDQLMLIEDVSDEIISAANEGKTYEEKISKKEEKIAEIESKYSEDTGLICTVTSLYNGGKYSLYGYKRYSDVRAVYFNESEMGLYGGDPDNFTYPRYDADFAFLRVYGDDGLPMKSPHYFKWSFDGPQVGDPLFVVGNPGSTNRLNTVAQLEYLRDGYYKNYSLMLNGMTDILFEMMNKYPDKSDEYENQAFLYSNSAKVYKESLNGLRDPYLMARKKAFEKEFKSVVQSNPELNSKFGHLWDAIAKVKSEMRVNSGERAAYGINPAFSSGYFFIAQDVLGLAEELMVPEEQRDSSMIGDALDTMIAGIFPADFNTELEDKKLALQADFITMNLGKDNALIQKMFGGKSGEEAAKYCLSQSKIKSKEDVINLLEKSPDAVFKSDDPFIYFILNTQEKLAGYQLISAELNQTEEALQDQLGQALFAVYGTSIPPDATFTLRINDGVMKKYDYNGTEAPMTTTFYGLYDRYYSHMKEYPWDISDKWKNPPPEFDLATPYNFITTHDITGGSSGSPVINKNAELVGIAFDGNIESIPANFLYTTEKNRMVSVASQAILEIVGDLLKLTRLEKELKTGKIYKEMTQPENEIEEVR
ncbi:MAG: S46 family peptidase [bacterium]